MNRLSLVATVLVGLMACSAQDSQQGGKPVHGGKQIRSMAELSSGYSSSEGDWLEFLHCWNDELQKLVHGRTEFAAVAELLVRSRENLSVPGSPQHKDRLNALERFGALDRRLPKSYRDFASITGGSWVASIHVANSGFVTNLLPIEKVGLFKEVDRLNWGGWHRAMGGENPASYPVPAEVYYRYDNEQQDDFRWEYLDSLVKVGELEQGAVLLLNPRDITADGEWEAWLLSTQVGASRYRSFAELMQTIAYKKILGVGGVHIPPAKLNATCARHLKTVANLAHESQPRREP